MLTAIEKGWNEKDWGMLAGVHSPDWDDHTAYEGMNDLATIKRLCDEFTTRFSNMEMHLVLERNRSIVVI